MGTHMKTTIDIADDLLERAKRKARRENKTLREVIEEALRRQLTSKPSGLFRLKRHSFKGKGLNPQLSSASWERLRELAYEGHGG